ncbi:FecR domain-containing protein [Pedobacter sp. Du54]|uniref:FecR family protein n=1 Tax=Pedobacter anseongensis TaxID=3133439 RepID=UPI0030A0BEBF
MTRSKERLQALLKRQFERSISQAEKDELSEYILDPMYAQELLAQLPDLLSIELTDQDLNERQKENVLSYIFNYGQKRKATTYPNRLWPRLIAAASIVVVASIGFYFYNTSRKTEQQSVYANDVDPGKNGATLTLADGKKILINEVSAGNIALQSGVRISKTADGQIIYEITSNNSGKIEYNTLTTTRGEQTQVRLPDGSLVFLNAASSLKFPTSFAKLKDRSVEISGEGYFEIVKDKAHPFIVRNKKQQVEVIGTHFNVNAYNDEPSVKTTLLEGSIKISTDQNNKVLKPGEQAVNSNEKLTIGEVDVDKAVAWKNSKFVFDDENIESVMRKLSRWYNVEVVYQDNVADRTFTGSISRYDKISKILDKITYIEAVHFKVEGRRITVMK